VEKNPQNTPSSHWPKHYAYLNSSGVLKKEPALPF
jgi:hypothetical protein